MNVILVMVQTADGKTTKGDNPTLHGWSSPEDLAHFALLKSKHRVLVMGKNTYLTLKEKIVPQTSLRRIVMTHSPDQFSDKQVDGQLEFTAETPEALVTRLAAEGYESLLLVGGSMLNTAFLEKKLITQCYLTIEPRFFGSGNTLFAPYTTDVALRLATVTKLNDQGTLLIHYHVV
ncbi:MAG: dihydrofolate reductase family protein [Patescibacteria group bacterium]